MPTFRFSIDRVKTINQVQTVSKQADTLEEARQQVETDIANGQHQNDFGWKDETVKYSDHMITPE